MKKLLIGLTVIISFFIFVSNVNAYSSYTPKSYTNNDFIILNTLGLNKEEIYSYANSMPMGNLKSDFISNSIIKLRDYYETNFSNTFDFYIITFRFSSDGLYYSTDGAYLVLFNEDDLTSDINYLNNQYTYSAVTNIYFGQLKNITYIYKTRDANTISKLSDNYGYARWIAGSTGSSQNTQIKMSKYYETNYNFNIYLNNENSIYTYSKLIYNDITYNPGDFLFNTLESNNLNNIKPQEPTEPELDITSILKNELGEKIKINFSEFDKEKYIYLYNFNNQPGNENWHEITENDYEYSTLLNGTLYVKMIDREQFLLNGDTTPVVSATYTFTDLLMYEDVIDTYNMSDYAEIEYRYYGNNPAMFYYTTYRYGEVPEDTYCITGTGIYECNILNIKEITSNFYYYTTIETEESEYLYKRIFAYEDSPTYSIKEYDHAIIEDLTKYPVNSDFFYNHYRSFTLDLSMYLKEENRGRYVYVYYSTDIYDKTIKTSQSSWNNDTNTNNKLDDLNSETIKPPTYQENTEKEDNYFLGFFIDLINKKFPIINQLSFIISTFSIKENDDIPNLTVDLSSMGIPGEVTIIDIETYKQCREMLFFFEYFGICIIGIPKIINNIKSSLGGDK